MWWTILPFVLMTVAVIIVPGFVVNAAAGLRLWYALGFAPLTSVGVVAVAAVVAEAVGVGWSALPVVVLTAVVALLVAGARWLLTRSGAIPGPTRLVAQDRPWWQSSGVWTAGSLVIAATVLSIDGLRMLVSPASFSQTYDSVYHLNALRWIVDNRNGSSFAIRMLTGDGPASFYPSAWHDLASVSLISMGSQNVPAGNNALILVVLALVWPVSCLLLVRTAFSHTAGAILATGVLTASFGAFPYLLVGFGVLYPNFLGLALLPAVMALAVSLLGLGQGDRFDVFPTLVVGLFGMVALALAHPNVALTMVGVVAPLMVIVWAVEGVLLDRHGGTAKPTTRWRLLAVAGLLGVSFVLFLFMHAPYGSLFWPVSRSYSHAVGEALLLAPKDTPVPLLGAVLATTGIYCVLRWNRHWWLLLTHLGFWFLWIVVAAGHIRIVRFFFGAPWYNDAFRLASLLPITAIPLAALGFQFFFDKLEGVVDRRLAGNRPEWVTPALLALCVLVLLVGTQAGGKQRAVDAVRGTYLVTADSALVDTDEYNVIRQVPDIVPPEEVIAVNPWNGSSMTYALTGRRTTATHVQYSPDPDQQVLIDRLNEAGTDAQVCQALHDLGVHWVLDFGNTRLINNEDRAYPGFEDLVQSPGFVLRAQSGHAALYEITACGLG